MVEKIYQMFFLDKYRGTVGVDYDAGVVRIVEDPDGVMRRVLRGMGLNRLPMDQFLADFPRRANNGYNTLVEMDTGEGDNG